MKLLLDRNVRKLGDDELNGCVHLLMVPGDKIVFRRGKFWIVRDEYMGKRNPNKLETTLLGPGLVGQRIPNYFTEVQTVVEKILSSGFHFRWEIGNVYRAVKTNRAAWCYIWRAEIRGKKQRIRVRRELKDNHRDPVYFMRRVFLEAVVKYNCGLITLGTAGEIMSTAAELMTPEPGITLIRPKY